MRTTLFVTLLALRALATHAQSSIWNFHPLNMIPCSEWINPAPGCGGCSSCGTAINSEPNIMDGATIAWSADLVLCPHPFDTLGNNVVLISGWPLEADPGSYVYGQVVFWEELRIDTLEVIAAKANGGPDSMDIAIQYNGTDPSQTISLMQGALDNQLQTYTITDLGCVPMWGAGMGWANIHVRAHGGDQGFLFKGLRVVASACATNSTAVAELHQEEVTIHTVNDGVRITTQKPLEVSICDALGRVTFYKSAAAGSAFAPLTDGVNIVRAGDTVKKIVR
ncbi:MAG: hypothetical protein KA175_03320 [Flavobacteriales bacterium]|nr:hypothetical protein [Flavobacteriales bacterium]MBP6696623.1 hypothetical protein [Flavobacteriales bacterium]